MYLTIQVNNRKLKAEKGETILSALNRNGIMIPTLCRMKEFSPTGACRMCVVEVEGRDRLVTACSQPVEEWMKIKTHSPRVITARRTIVELLLSNHPDDCLYCDRNLNCELQKLSEELNIRDRRIRARKIRPRLDQSSPAIVRELSKCILCGRCVRVCEEVITSTSIDFINRGRLTHVGPALDRDFNFSSCIHCGQCVLVCPTAALHERHYLNEVQEFLNKPDLVKIIQYSPLVSMSIANELGMKYSRDFDRILNSIFRKIGFEKVFTTGTGADILITELSGQLQERINGNLAHPVIMSACPAWVKYAEQFLPSMLPELSPVKAPQQITGTLIKSIVADEANLRPEDIYSVSATPCIAMKFEARRDGMMRKGISDVDSVLTVREVVRLIKLYGIDVTNIEPEPADEPLSVRSSAAALAEVSGGLTEAVIRSLIFLVEGKDPERGIFKKLRTAATFREAGFNINGKEVFVAVVDGLSGLEKLRANIAAGKAYDLVEVMTCPGGCVNGAGLPFSDSRDEKKIRAKLIYQADETDAVNLPAKVPSLEKIYENIVKGKKDKTDKKLFYTHFEKRDVLL
jgi:iron-only hydrogenase group A